MRHNKKFNHLSRTSTHRKAMLANMAVSLIRHKRISTTLAKAKALRMYVEPLLTKAKNDTTHSRRIVFSYLQNKEAVAELFRDVAVKIADRPGGYTRILRTGYRFGDNAEMCIIELVDYNENMLKDTTAKKTTRTRRSRRGGGGGAAAAATATDTAAAPKADKVEKTDKAEITEKEQVAKAEKGAVKAEAKTEEAKAETKAKKVKEEAAEKVEAEVKAEPKAEEVKEEPKKAKEAKTPAGDSTETAEEEKAE